MKVAEDDRILGIPGERYGVANGDGFGEEVGIVDDDGEVVDAGASDGELHRGAAIFDVGDDAGEAEPGRGCLADAHMVGTDGDVDRRARLLRLAAGGERTAAVDLEDDHRVS